MKIVCTKKEFARLIRECDKITGGYHGCGDCAMSPFCAEEVEIEDLVEIREEPNED